MIVYYLFTPHLPSPLSQAPPIQFSMNNQTVPGKPDLVVFIQIPTQCTKHTQTDCNVACKHTHTHTHKVHLHSLSANMLQPHQQTIQALHHKAQICTSGCTRSCVLALIKSHSKMCAHTYIVASINTSICKRIMLKITQKLMFWNQMYYVMYVRQFHDVNSHSVGCLLHYEGRDPADRPIPSMQQFYLHSVFFTQQGDPAARDYQKPHRTNKIN